MKLDLPEPPAELQAHSRRLADLLGQRIRDQGPLPFSAYMDAVLYEPGLGYYAAGLRKFGAGGDFITAPELGKVFARCLARQAEEIATELGQWNMLEIGAGTGCFAVDFLAALPADRLPASYAILERSADLRAVQARTLAVLPTELTQRIVWLDAPPTEPWQGLLFANEVLDALPVERFEIGTGGSIHRLCVDLNPNGFHWAHSAAPAVLDAAVGAALGDRRVQLAPGYRSEFCSMLPAWLESISSSMQCGCLLFTDYGYPRSAYYAPERRDGTLICHYLQRAHADPFWWPGLQDLSASVDFTALAAAGLSCGLECAGYTSQAQFLIGCGLEQQLTDLSEFPDRERWALAGEVRELMLPENMGERFQAMALIRDFALPLRGFSAADQRQFL